MAAGIVGKAFQGPAAYDPTDHILQQSQKVFRLAMSAVETPHDRLNAEIDVGVSLVISSEIPVGKRHSVR